MRDKEVNKKSEDDEIDDECCSKAHCTYDIDMHISNFYDYSGFAFVCVHVFPTLFPKKSGSALRFSLFKCMHIIDLLIFTLISHN